MDDGFRLGSFGVFVVKLLFLGSVVSCAIFSRSHTVYYALYADRWIDRYIDR